MAKCHPNHWDKKYLRLGKCAKNSMETLIVVSEWETINPGPTNYDKWLCFDEGETGGDNIYNWL